MTSNTSGSAYELLSKPTLELTDEEATRVIAELRQKRHAYVTEKKADNPKKAATKAPPSAEEKALNTASIAAAMNLDFNLGI